MYLYYGVFNTNKINAYQIFSNILCNLFKQALAPIAIDFNSGNSNLFGPVLGRNCEHWQATRNIFNLIELF